jgi:hypothetical protein
MVKESLAVCIILIYKQFDDLLFVIVKPSIPKKRPAGSWPYYNYILIG